MFPYFFLIPNYQSDLESIPNEGDEIQYWEIAYGIFNSGEYKREVINNNADEYSKLELGYRRGEPVYPLIIASIMRVQNFSNDIPIENCLSINCEVFDEAVKLLVFLAYVMKISIVMLVFKN